MVKYRRLAVDELTELKQQFVAFLAGNGVDAQHWDTMKKETPDKSYDLIDQFSDLVYENVLDKVEYLIFNSSKVLRELKFTSQKVYMKGVEVAQDSQIDLTQVASAEGLKQLFMSEGNTIQLFSAEKELEKDMKVEIFQYMEKGYLISKGNLFDIFTKLEEVSK